MTAAWSELVLGHEWVEPLIASEPVLCLFVFLTQFCCTGVHYCSELPCICQWWNTESCGHSWNHGCNVSQLRLDATQPAYTNCRCSWCLPYYVCTARLFFVVSSFFHWVDQLSSYWLDQLTIHYWHYCRTAPMTAAWSELVLEHEWVEPLIASEPVFFVCMLSHTVCCTSVL